MNDASARSATSLTFKQIWHTIETDGVGCKQSPKNLYFPWEVTIGKSATLFMVSQISTSCLIEYLRITTLSATAALKSEHNANMPGSIPWGMLRDVCTPWFNSDTTLTSLLRGDLLAWEADAMRPRQDEISKHNKTLITKALFV